MKLFSWADLEVLKNASRHRQDNGDDKRLMAYRHISKQIS
jgi:hypothetical protein